MKEKNKIMDYCFDMVKNAVEDLGMKLPDNRKTKFTFQEADDNLVITLNMEGLEACLTLDANNSCLELNSIDYKGIHMNYFNM